MSELQKHHSEMAKQLQQTAQTTAELQQLVGRIAAHLKLPDLPAPIPAPKPIDPLRTPSGVLAAMAGSKTPRGDEIEEIGPGSS